MSVEVSPESKCPICLDIFDNLSCLDHCLHMFCFCCIREWSKNKAECPLCKQPFNSIYHSINSDHDYKRYDLKPVDNDSSRAGQFRYHRQIQGGTSLSSDNIELNIMTSFPNSTSDSSLEEETQENRASPLPTSHPHQADVTEEDAVQDECLSSDSDDCVIVGFVKPTAERTPELVKLSSDSDESGVEDTKEQSPLPQHTFSLTASHSTDPSAGPSKNTRKRRPSIPETCSSFPSTKKKFNQDKPGGKRKYKAKHLEEPLEIRDIDSDGKGDSYPKRKKKGKKRHSQKS